MDQPDRLFIPPSYIENKLVSVQKHSYADLYIHNYTAKAQYDRVWDEITLQCRGLITDGKGKIVARPFHKFFNLEELGKSQLPTEPFEVFEKMDGSLGILYWVEDTPYIATRGSFNSEQADIGTHILYTQYSYLIDELNKEHTYLFEIIYPANRIVVDYKGERDLVLLAVIETATGKELSLPNIGFTKVKQYKGIKDYTKLSELEKPNREGFVIKFASGLRVKVKFEEYVRLHRVITGVSTKSVWEYLSEGRDLQEMLDRVPDEFYDWVKETEKELTGKFVEIAEQCRRDFKELPSRKETALYFNTCQYPKILFSMLTGKDYAKQIWKLVKPAYAKPFTVEV